MNMKRVHILSIVALLATLGCDRLPKLKELLGGEATPTPAANPVSPKKPATAKRTPPKAPRTAEATPTPAARQQSGARADGAAGITGAVSRRRLSKSVRLPTAAVLGGLNVPAGRYAVVLTPDERDGASISLLNEAGKHVATELAVMPVKQPRNRREGSWLWRDKRHEKMYRIYSQKDGALYFITLAVQ